MKQPDMDERRMLKELSETIQKDCSTEPGATNAIVNYLWQNSVIGIQSNSTYKTTYQSVNRFLCSKNYTATLRRNKGNVSETMKQLGAVYCISQSQLYKDIKKK